MKGETAVPPFVYFGNFPSIPQTHRCILLDLPQVIISAGRPDAGLTLAPAGMVAAMAGQVGELCQDE
jgi:prolyl-tRNA editing enzyme YbaK/EbsC (Cys-tRNA(Pro) deacylase)